MIKRNSLCRQIELLSQKCKYNLLTPNIVKMVKIFKVVKVVEIVKVVKKGATIETNEQKERR